MMWFYFVLLVTIHSTNGQKATQQTLDSLRGPIEALLNADSQNIAGFVRVAFHDSVGAGGLDGCIDYDDEDNRGIKAYTDLLNSLYETVKGTITRADLYAYASIIALERGAENDNVNNDEFDISRFQVGRVDCSEDGNENDVHEELPTANFGNLNDVVAYFRDMYDFDQRETIALMGAHTLGRARTENSGYEGPWINGNGPNILDNEYYRELVGPPWFHKSLPTPNRFQWQKNPTPATGNGPETRNDANQRNILLNCDSALAFDFNIDSNGDLITQCVMCGRRNAARGGGTCCARNAGYAISDSYARNNAAWLTDFTNVFYKMINTKATDLSDPTDEPPTEAQTTTTTTTQPPATTTQSPITEAPIRPPSGRGGGRARGRGRGRGRKRSHSNSLMRSINSVQHLLDEIKRSIKKRTIKN